jgi:hypothetical protein
MANTTHLSANYTVEQYKKLEAAQNKGEIAKFFVERFTERYITPINLARKKQKHGFCTMAVSCLMIEALESFWCGWPHTKDRSALAFCQFFSRCPRFHAFLGHAPDFYRHVRCGILHQAETTGGWTIHRGKGSPMLFDPNGPAIDATKFHKAVSEEITDHANLLKSEDWNSERWRNFRKKMAAVCKNC